MPRKKPPTGTAADLNLSTIAELMADEEKAIAFFERIRWPNGPICPRCGSTESYKIVGKPTAKRPARPGLRTCKKCRKQFTVKVGTVFEESKIPMRQWLGAMHLMTSSKKGVSSRQIERELGVTIKTAWFITHRIREAMKAGPLAAMLTGVVEVDETYVGGKPRYRQSKDFGTPITGRGTKKAPVAALVQRDGGVVCKPVERVNAASLKGAIREHVSRDAVIVTDQYPSYVGLKKEFKAHHRINHEFRHYSRKEGDLTVTTNTVESFFALLKRGHYGIFHHLSKKHLHRYCDEFAFRWNHRKVSDGERMAAAIRGAEGKRLRYA